MVATYWYVIEAASLAFSRFDYGGYLGGGRSPPSSPLIWSSMDELSAVAGKLPDGVMRSIVGGSSRAIRLRSSSSARPVCKDRAPRVSSPIAALTSSGVSGRFGPLPIQELHAFLGASISELIEYFGYAVA